jgi:hypothetical protein
MFFHKGLLVRGEDFRLILPPTLLEDCGRRVCMAASNIPYFLSRQKKYIIVVKILGDVLAFTKV